MRYLWDEAKRQANLSKHGLDFADAEKVFAGPMVLIVHVESDDSIRIISMRKAESDETDLFYRNAGYF